MKNRKTIGVIVGRPDEPFQTKFLRSVGREAFKYDMDVLVFSNMLRTGGYTDYQLGEERIMELVNYDMLDAVILVPDSLQMHPGYAQEIAGQIRQKFNGVRVSIDLWEEGFEMFACDDAAGVREVVSHLIEVHGCTDIAFLTGPKEHPHSGNRLLGYRQAMAQAGLSVDEERIYYGDFWYDEGERVVEELLASERGLPQAIACGSDTMAVSVCYALQKWKIRVPEDVLVTGYDCEVSEGEEEGFITSAVRGVLFSLLSFLQTGHFPDYFLHVLQKPNCNPHSFCSGKSCPPRHTVYPPRVKVHKNRGIPEVFYPRQNPLAYHLTLPEAPHRLSGIR